MNCPPNKRFRGLDHEVVTAVPFDDPFGDDEDFTQDDLDEIDIIASQAITSAASGSKPGTKPVDPVHGSACPPCVGQRKPLSRPTTNHSRGNSSSNRVNAGISNREPLSNRQQQIVSDREDSSYSLLEAQHAELKRKLKEVEEEIVLKSGEIRVLRDSLKAAQQEKEAQRQNHILLETQRQREQSDREKELNRKVQSLQSELQFKEAEINEIKTKLHSSDRSKTASPLSRTSPKVLSCLAQVHHGSGSSSSSVTGNGFITKETFGSQVIPRTTLAKTRRDDRGASSSRSGDSQEVSCPDPFLSVRPAHLQHRGGVLLGLLLQQPLSPSSLGLSHLLSISQTDFLASSGSSTDFLLHSDAAACRSSGGGGAPRAAVRTVQSLALTGLNMLSQNRTEAAVSSRNNRSCPGAVLLLPLLDLHLSRLCQSLDFLRSSSARNNGSDSSAASSLPAGTAHPTAGLGRLEETGVNGFSLEDTGLTVLRLLYLLLAQSDEVVEAVLSKETQSTVTADQAERSAAGVGLCSQNALLQSVLRLCEAGLGRSSLQREELVFSAMKTLCVLIQRTPQALTNRLQCVLQVMCVCLSGSSSLQRVSECVSILMPLSDHQTLAQQLCSQHDPCVFLKLFQFVRTRPDKQATRTDWILLDLQVIRLLSRLKTQAAESWSANLHSSCQCYTELVQTVVIVFHRQWLDLRDFQELTDSTGLAPPSSKCSAPLLPWWCSPAASLLRECLLLLHWLLLHHGNFSESCRPLLHMYDQSWHWRRSAAQRETILMTWILILAPDWPRTTEQTRGTICDVLDILHRDDHRSECLFLPGFSVITTLECQRLN